jgi:hypothetical protein
VCAWLQFGRLLLPFLPMPPLRVLARGIYIDIEQIKPDKAACRLRSVGFA